ncbi:MAG: VWA domain-containing protein, partial [Bryobacteraceae bacterium]
MRAIIAAFFIAPLVGMAQTAVKFEATAQLVVVNISAKDKGGEPMVGLKASDFTVTEDGKPQQIKVFEFQRLEDAVLVAAPTVVKAAVATQIAPAKPGEVKYKDRRLLVLFFDQAGMPVADQIRAQQAALKFLNAQMTPSDLVAVLTYSTDLTVLQDFTNDRDRLTQVVKSLSIGDVGMTN